jgi:organic hydroperoxide reductase OsmC/OhrA
MSKQHTYKATIKWMGNKGTGTNDYREYERSHSVFIDGKPEIPASSDAPFRGDVSKHNPEDFLMSALSSCHMLWYLHLCADAGVVVMGYTDNATGVMVEVATGGGHFTEVMLNPVVTVTNSSMIEKANALHDKAHEKCFIANSVNFKVAHNPVCIVAEKP